VYKRRTEEQSEIIKQLRKDLEQKPTSSSQFMTQQPLASLENANVNPTPSANPDGTLILPKINQKHSDNVKVSKRSFILQSDQSNIMFTKLDAVQNLKRLRGALTHGRVNEQAFEVNKFFFKIQQNQPANYAFRKISSKLFIVY
jgi:hypothetical protein